MTLSEIHESWEADAKINPNELAQESNEIPKLHAKYLKELSFARSEYRTEKQRLKKLEFDKYQYFSGRMSTDELTKRKWKPFPHKILKNDIDKHIEGDSDVLAQKLRLGEAEEKVNVLESIIDNVNRRSFTIGNAIKWHQFTNGVI